jgi:hypothetical protein
MDYHLIGHLHSCIFFIFLFFVFVSHRLSENKIIQLLGFLNAFQVSSDRILSANNATLARIELAHTQAKLSSELEKGKSEKRRNEGAMISELLIEPELLSENEDEMREDYRRKNKGKNDTMKKIEKVEIGESVRGIDEIKQLKKENLDLLRDDMGDDNESLLSFPYSSSFSASSSLRERKTKSKTTEKNTNTNIQKSFSQSLDYTDCTTLNIEVEKEVENLSDCSDDSFLSAVEDYFPIEKSFSGSKSDDAIDQVEELNNLIKQTESFRSQLMSDIRLVEGNKNKELFLSVLQDDLRVCEKELHQLKIRYVESLLIADSVEMREGNVVVEKTKESEEAAAGLLLQCCCSYCIIVFIFDIFIFSPLFYWSFICPH